MQITGKPIKSGVLAFLAARELRYV